MGYQLQEWEEVRHQINKYLHLTVKDDKSFLKAVIVSHSHP